MIGVSLDSDSRLTDVGMYHTVMSLEDNRRVQRLFNLLNSETVAIGGHSQSIRPTVEFSLEWSFSCAPWTALPDVVLDRMCDYLSIADIAQIIKHYRARAILTLLLDSHSQPCKHWRASF